jgi:hypothetical protein
MKCNEGDKPWATNERRKKLLFCSHDNTVLVREADIGVYADWIKIKVKGVEAFRKDGAVIVDKDELRNYGFVLEYPMAEIMQNLK